MGIVYLAHDRLNGEMVALKQVQVPTEQLQFMSRSPSMVADDLRLSLAREFQILASLRHPHIISVLDYGFDTERQPYYTMTYLVDAQDILTAGKCLSAIEKLELIQQILQALAYLHRRGVLHRDIKPGNVLVANGRVRVLDFGLALTRTKEVGGSSGGTLAYWAPELWHNQPYQEAADLFAVGIVAYELLAGQHPFGPVDSFLFKRVLEEEPDMDCLGLDAGITAVLRKLLAKSPADRYQEPGAVLHDLCTALGEVAATEPLAIRESYLQAATFVGREKEMHQLQGAISQVAAGESAIWLIGGESGVGKSRLADEVRIQVMVQGQQVIRGQAVAGRGLPFQLWREPVRRLLLSQKVTAFQAAILKDIVPDIAALLGQHVSDAPPMVGPAYQQRLILAIVDLLRELVEPVVLLLEDLQWAGEDLNVLRQMIKVREQLPGVMVLGTYRHDEYPNLPAELPEAQVLMLNRLHDADIAKLSQAMLGKGGNHPRIVSLLTQETEGNTFFILEVMRALAEEAGQLADIGTMTLPDVVFTSGMRHLLQRRILKVLAADRPLLQVAAVAGRQLDLRLLAVLAPDEDLEAWLSRTSVAMVLTIRDEQWVFAHDKLREAILTDLVNVDRHALHRRVAEGLELIYPDDANYNETLLFHWHQAGDLDREMHYLPFVAQHLIEVSGNHEHARDLLKQGLQTLPEDDARRITLLGWLADSYQRQGNYTQANELAQQIRSLALQWDHQPGLATALHLLGLVARNQGAYQQAKVYHEQSMDIQQEIGDQYGVAISLNNLGLAFYRQGDFAQAYTYLQQSLYIKQEIGTQLDIAGALNNLGLITKNRGDYIQARTYFQQCLAIKEALGDRSGIASSLNNLGIIASNLGDYAQAHDYYQQSLAIKHTIGDPRGVASTLGNLGLLAHRQGDFAQARHYLEQGYAIFQSIGEKRGAATGLHDLGEVAYRQKDYVQARDYLQQSLAAHKEMGAQSGIASCYNRLGFVYLQLHPKQALESFLEALALAHSIHATPLVLEAVVGFAWLYLQSGNLSRAGNLVGLVQDHSAYNSDVQGRLEDFMPLLKQNLAPVDLQMATAYGKSLDLEQVVPQLLEEFSQLLVEESGNAATK